MLSNLVKSSVNISRRMAVTNNANYVSAFSSAKPNFYVAYNKGNYEVIANITNQKDNVMFNNLKQNISTTKVSEQLQMANHDCEYSIYLYSKGEIDESERILKNIVNDKEIVQRFKDHQLMITCLDNLAQIEIDRENYAEAQTYLVQCIEKYKCLYPNSFPFNKEVCITKLKLAKVYNQDGKFVEARNELLSVLAIYRELYSGSYPQYSPVAEIYLKLAVVYANMGEVEKAKKHCKRSITLFSQIFAVDNVKCQKANAVMNQLCKLNSEQMLSI